MGSNRSWCYRCVDETRWVKNGKTNSGKQRLLCKQCGRTRVATFSYNACHDHISQAIVTLTKEGLGIRATARVLHISVTTVLKRLLRIAAGIQRPVMEKDEPTK